MEFLFFCKGDIVTKEIVLGNIKVRNVIVNLGNKFIYSIKEDCGGNVTLKLPAVKGDNVSPINCIFNTMKYK